MLHGILTLAGNLSQTLSSLRADKLDELTFLNLTWLEKYRIYIDISGETLLRSSKRVFLTFLPALFIIHGV